MFSSCKSTGVFPASGRVVVVIIECARSSHLWDFQEYARVDLLM